MGIALIDFNNYRKEWLDQNTKIVKVLFDLDDTQLVCIAVGTYLYAEKSASNILQRQMYSGQKNNTQ